MTNWDAGQSPYGQQPYGQPNHGPFPPAPDYQYQYPQPRNSNGLAIASLVLGILWIYWIGSILALVFGYVARHQIRQRQQGGDGLAIAGIVLGWVGVATLVIAIIVVASLASHH